MEGLILIGKPVISGKASGIALVSREPLSFWGGYDWKSGEITDRRHPLSGENAKGKVLVVIESGYLMNDKVIRYAKVVVGE